MHQWGKPMRNIVENRMNLTRTPAGRRSALAVAALAVVLLASGCGDLVSKITGKAKKSAAGDRRITIVQSGDFLVSVSATGRVIPDLEVEVTSKASGEIIEMPFDLGDVVKAGDLLIRLDPDDEERNVRKKQNQFLSAKAGRDKAQSELALSRSTHRTSQTNAESALKLGKTRLAELTARFERQKKLFEEGLISEQEFEVERTALQDAETGLTRARAGMIETQSLEHVIESRVQDVALAEVKVSDAQIELEEARERLDETEVRASLDGIITAKHVEPGMVISSALANVGGGTQLLMLSDLNRLYVLTAVDETDIGGIRLGQEAIIKADAYPDETFSGKVFHIAPVGIAVTSVVSFDVKVEIMGDGLDRLRPGMTADIEIVTQRSNDTHWVQSEAVHQEEGETWIEVEGSSDEPERRTVQVGLKDGLRTEITEGVEAEEEILLPDLSALSAWERGEDGNRPLKNGDRSNRDNGRARRR